MESDLFEEWKTQRFFLYKRPRMESFLNIYEEYMKLGDKRLEDWPLMKTPAITSFILIAYFASIYLIKSVMRDRAAFSLKGFLFFYNFCQVVVSLYISVEIFMVAYESKYSLVCAEVEYSSKPLPMRMASVLWVYFIVKIVDLLDTVIFSLRKKSSQITFLHVFHHFSMVCNAWAGVKFVAGGQTFFLAMLNSFVHVIMYSYYGFSAMGPSVQKYLWWKKYLTQLQLLQFLVIMVHSIVNVSSSCSYPKGFSWAFVIYGVFITALFTNFYIQSYRLKTKKKPTKTS